MTTVRNTISIALLVVSAFSVADVLSANNKQSINKILLVESTNKPIRV